MKKVIIVEPYRTFKEKMKITKKYDGCKVEIMGNLIYIEKWIEED